MVGFVSFNNQCLVYSCLSLRILYLHDVVVVVSTNDFEYSFGMLATSLLYRNSYCATDPISRLCKVLTNVNGLWVSLFCIGWSIDLRFHKTFYNVLTLLHCCACPKSAELGAFMFLPISWEFIRDKKVLVLDKLYFLHYYKPNKKKCFEIVITWMRLNLIREAF